jgi:hypothetical protein
VEAVTAGYPGPLGVVHGVSVHPGALDNYGKTCEESLNASVRHRRDADGSVEPVRLSQRECGLMAGRCSAGRLGSGETTAHRVGSGSDGVAGSQEGRRGDDQQDGLDDEAGDSEWFGPVADVIGVVRQSWSAGEHIAHDGADSDSQRRQPPQPCLVGQQQGRDPDPDGAGVRRPGRQAISSPDTRPVRAYPDLGPARADRDK